MQDRPDPSDVALEIRPLERPPDAWATVPGSKSITNRALVLGALAGGTTVLEGALESDDVAAMVEGLRALGFSVDVGPTLAVRGAGGRIPVAAAEIDARGAGTVARFLLALAALGHGRFRVDGNPRMRQRPMGPLVAALRALGVRIEELGAPGCLPLEVRAAGIRGGAADLDAEASSQFLSALLMVAPCADREVVLRLVGGLPARPYVDMTRRMMAAFGAGGVRADGPVFSVTPGSPGRPRYLGRRYRVEPDASSASYFLAAAALTGGTVRVRGLDRDALQGDAGFVDVLERMGCRVAAGAGALAVTGPPPGGLRGVDVDLSDMSDLALTLAAMGPFADRPTRIRGVGHIRLQESDRLRAAVAELRRLGVRAEETADGLVVHPGEVRPATVETYADHRVAMAFAVVGLVRQGIRISDPGCVEKTFPGFFAALDQLRAPSSPGSSPTLRCCPETR